MIKKLIRDFRQRIENTPWDETVLESERFLNAAAWLALAVAAIYVTPIAIGILTR